MTDDTPIAFSDGVTLAGGGDLDAAMLAEALALCPALVAADGAADRVRALGHLPDAVVGDLDSLRDRTALDSAGVPVRHVAEQDSTDFEKCLYATDAPAYLGVGFTGGRVDHMLAVFQAMLKRREKRVVLLGAREVITLLPEAGVAIDQPAGAVVSLVPLVPATGVRSAGLRWPIDGLAMAPGVQGGTSNEATGGRVEIAFDRPGVLLILERQFLGALWSVVAS